LQEAEADREAPSGAVAAAQAVEWSANPGTTAEPIQAQAAALRVERKVTVAHMARAVRVQDITEAGKTADPVTPAFALAEEAAVLVAWVAQATPTAGLAAAAAADIMVAVEAAVVPEAAAPVTDLRVAVAAVDRRMLSRAQ